LQSAACTPWDLLQRVRYLSVAGHHQHSVGVPVIHFPFQTLAEEVTKLVVSLLLDCGEDVDVGRLKNMASNLKGRRSNCSMSDSTDAVENLMVFSPIIVLLQSLTLSPECFHRRKIAKGECDGLDAVAKGTACRCSYFFYSLTWTQNNDAPSSLRSTSKEAKSGAAEKTAARGRMSGLADDLDDLAAGRDVDTKYLLNMSKWLVRSTEDIFQVTQNQMCFIMQLQAVVTKTKPMKKTFENGLVFDPITVILLFIH
jgi:hypothetical protein